MDSCVDWQNCLGLRIAQESGSGHRIANAVQYNYYMILDLAQFGL